MTGVEPAAGSGAYAAFAAWRPFIILQEAAGSTLYNQIKIAAIPTGMTAILVRVTGVEPAAS